MRRISVALAALALSAAIAQAAPPYRIISEYGAADALRVAVRLDARQPEADLRQIADDVRSRLPQQKRVRNVTFYLPFMNVADAAWAEVKLTPAVAVTVSGLRLEEELAYQREASADTRPQIGVWLTSPPALAGKLTLYRDGRGKTFAEWQLRSGQKTTDEVSEVRTSRGRRYEIAGSNGGYYQIGSGGTLELGTAATVIAVAEPLKRLPETKVLPPAVGATLGVPPQLRRAPAKADDAAAIAPVSAPVVAVRLKPNATIKPVRRAVVVRSRPTAGADAFTGDTISAALSR
jgi:hypothetical protein